MHDCVVVLSHSSISPYSHLFWQMIKMRKLLRTCLTDKRTAYDSCLFFTIQLCIYKLYIRNRLISKVDIDVVKEGMGKQLLQNNICMLKYFHLMCGSILIKSDLQTVGHHFKPLWVVIYLSLMF